MYDLLRGLPTGEAVLVPSRWEPNARQETFWAVRMMSSEIESLKAKVREDGLLPVRQRATLNRCLGIDGKTEVLVVAVLLGLGSDPIDPASVYVGLIDEHHPIFGHRLEALTTQDTVGVVFIGDSQRIECATEVGNIVRPFAQKALAMISAAPPWSPADFKHAGVAWKQRYPNRAVLWNEIGENTSGGLKRFA